MDAHLPPGKPAELGVPSVGWTPTARERSITHKRKIDTVFSISVANRSLTAAGHPRQFSKRNTTLVALLSHVYGVDVNQNMLKEVLGK